MAMIVVVTLGIAAWVAAMFWAFGPWPAVVLLVPIITLAAVCIYLFFVTKIGDFGE